MRKAKRGTTVRLFGSPRLTSPRLSSRRRASVFRFLILRRAFQASEGKDRTREPIYWVIETRERMGEDRKVQIWAKGGSWKMQIKRVAREQRRYGEWEREILGNQLSDSDNFTLRLRAFQFSSEWILNVNAISWLPHPLTSLVVFFTDTRNVTLLSEVYLILFPYTYISSRQLHICHLSTTLIRCANIGCVHFERASRSAIIASARNVSFASVQTTLNLSNIEEERKRE